MTNLDRVLKSRGITLPTMVHLVRAMVFPIVMYGYESWTIKKAEHCSTDAFKLRCWKKLFESPVDSKKIKPANPKEIIPEYSWGGQMLKLQYFGHLMQRSDSLEKTLMLGKTKVMRTRGQ